MFIRSVFSAAPTAGTPPVNDDIVVSNGSAASLQPIAAIYQLTQTTTLGTAVAPYMVGVGITDGTTQRCQTALCENGVSAVLGDCDLRHDTATVVQVTLTTLGSRDGEANWDSWQNGGSRIAWSDLPAAAHQILGTYFFGTDISAAVASLTASSTDGGTASVTGLSFAPNFAFIIHHYTAFVADTITNNAAYGIGYAVQRIDGAIEQLAFTDWNDDRGNAALRTDGRGVIRDDCCAAEVTVLAPVDRALVSLTSWNSDGATFTTGGTPSTSLALAILFLRIPPHIERRAFIYDLENLSGITQGSETEFLVDPGFNPRSIFCIATALKFENSSDAGSTRGHFSHGIVSATDVAESGAMVGGQVEDQVTTPTNTRSLSKQGLAHIMDDSGGVHLSFDWNGESAAQNVGLRGAIFTGTPDFDFASIAKIGFVFLDGSFLYVNDTESITDNVVMVTGQTLNVSDTESITDNVVFIGSGALVTSDTETISDETVLSGGAIVVVSETESISETVVFSGGAVMVLDETETITDETVMMFLSNLLIVDSDTESIEDIVRFVGSAILVTSDTEEITEAAQQYLGFLVVPSDAVTITDTVVITSGVRVHAPTRGTTLQGGAEEGSSLAARAERGFVFG